MDALGPSLMILLALAIAALVTFAILWIMGESAGTKKGLDDYLKDFSDWPPNG